MSSGRARLAIIGGGNMGAALARGMLDGGAVSVDDLLVVEVSADRRAQLATLLPGVRTVARLEEGDDGEGEAIGAAVLAVKPADTAVAARAAARAGATRILSIAAGVPTSALHAAAGDGVAVLRAMPNTPALVGRGAAGLCRGPGTSDDDVAWAGTVLGAVGTVDQVTEAQLDAVTGLSGSGPAYLLLVAEALIDAGVHSGLPRVTSDRLVRQLFAGVAGLLERDEDPAAQRAAVTSPGGTTAEGLRVLEGRAVRAALIDAVAAATRRSVELGGP